MHRTIIEIGPASVRRLCCGTAESATAGAAALEWIDDPFALLDDVPVPVATLWRRVLDEVACSAGSMLLIHPSWWPAARIALIREVAPQPVETRARAELLGGVVVEIAATLVAIDAVGAVIPRIGPPDLLADAVAHRVTGTGTVLIDAPAGVPGSDALAALIAQALRATGVRTAAARLRAPDPPAPPRPATPRRRRRYPAVVAALPALIVGALIAHRESAPAPTVLLVEGRVAVAVPADWPAQRITDGPGSARVQLVSPVDPQQLLHLTQTPVLDPDLAAVAERLGRAIDDANERAAVFADFNPVDTRAGRPAISYAEHRPGHRIDWTVLLDAGVRIGIGCQQRDGDPGVLSEVCERAVRTARTLPAQPH